MDASIVMDPPIVDSSTVVQQELVLADSQLLYWSLVDDGAIPDGFLSHFILLMSSVDAAAARLIRKFIPLCQRPDKLSEGSSRRTLQPRGTQKRLEMFRVPGR